MAGLLGRMQDWDRVEDHPDPVHPIHLRETEDEKASSKSIEKHIFFLKFWILFPIVIKITADNSAVYIH